MDSQWEFNETSGMRIGEKLKVLKDGSQGVPFFTSFQPCSTFTMDPDGRENRKGF